MTRSTGILIAVFLALAVSPWLVSDFYVFLFTKILFLSLLSASFILLAGFGGMLSLAQTAFFGVAGYIVARFSLFYEWPLLRILPLALLGAIVVSAIFASIAVRTRDIYFLMMSLSLNQMVYYGALQWSEITGGFDGLTGMDPPILLGRELLTSHELYYFTLIPVLVCYLFLRRFAASPFGLALQGVRDNSQRMAALGFRVSFIRFFAIVVSGVLAGIAGVLATYFYGMISPTSVSMGSAVMVLFIALLGGTARFEGALVGAMVYVLVEDFVSMYTQRYQAVIGILFIVIVLFFPGGITGIFRRKAKRPSGSGAEYEPIAKRE